MNKTAEAAHVLLPSASYAEKDGTFTNFQGRVQRIYAALAPAGDAKPECEILGALGTLMGVNGRAPDAPSLFSELARAEPAFAGLSYASLGEQGALLKDAGRHVG
jgi:predicted molibdopterin-dependent oxidoreductase YjgC